jgi:sulfite reductase (ferredoxin)
MPCYEVLVGGRVGQGSAHLAYQVAVVPAKNVPALVADVLGAVQLHSLGQAEKEQITDTAARYSHVPTIEQGPQFYQDFGSMEDFSLAGRGPGECGAGVLDVVELDVAQARQALKRATGASDAKSKSESIYEAIVATARALLITRGLEPKKDREIFAAFDEHLIQPGWVSQQTKDLLDQALDYRLGDVNDISPLAESVERILVRVEELFRSLDANLNFRVEPVSKNPPEEGLLKDNEYIIDLRGVECPLNFVKAKLELEKIAVGEVLEVLLGDGEPVANVPASFTEQGQEVLNVVRDGEHFRVKVRKRS